MTPRPAVALGAHHLVIGLPITEAADPDSAAQAIARDLEAL
jgi:orotidine-5'-phosphate decarboxylase